MIYFIGNAESRSIKIGISDDVDRRLGGLQIGSSDRLSILGVLPGDADDESRWHRRWRHLRRRGEWFVAEADLIEEIRDRVAQAGFVPNSIGRASPAFLSLADSEPRLQHLYHLAASYHVSAFFDDNFCANAIWYGYTDPDIPRGIKGRMCQVVGYTRPDHDPRLSSRHAYEIAYHTLYEALPDCMPDCHCSNVFAALIGG